jgi:hypothetical protein
MYAQAVDRAAVRIRELRHEGWEDAALAAVAIGLSLAATRFRQELAVPLLLGGLGVGVLAVRAVLRRWELVDLLVLDRDAYEIAEVRSRAEQVATLPRRRAFAAVLNTILDDPAAQRRLERSREELEELVRELDDDGLVLDPFCAVACERLLSDASGSPLMNAALPAEDVRSRVRQIRAGFRPRPLRDAEPQATGQTRPDSANVSPPTTAR